MIMSRKRSGKSARLEFGRRGREQVEQTEHTPTSMERFRETASRWLQKLRHPPTTKPTKPNRSMGRAQ